MLALLTRLPPPFPSLSPHCREGGKRDGAGGEDVKQAADAFVEGFGGCLAHFRVRVKDLIAPSHLAGLIHEHETEIVLIEVQGVQPFLRRDGTWCLQSQLSRHEFLQDWLLQAGEPPRCRIRQGEALRIGFEEGRCLTSGGKCEADLMKILV
jgi:hypothetical protein